jgi:ATP synthase protein I
VTLRRTRIQADLKAAFRIVAVQVVITLAVAAVCGLGWDMKAAVSAVCGGLIGAAATSFMALALFRHPEGTSAARIAWSFFLGEFLKVALSIGLLLLALRSAGIAAGPLIVAYGATFAAYWFAPRGPAARH